MMDEAMPEGMYHLAGSEAEGMWIEYQSGLTRNMIDPAAVGLEIDFTGEPAAFDE